MLKMFNSRKRRAHNLLKNAQKAVEEWPQVPGEVRAVLANELVYFCYVAQPK